MGFSVIIPVFNAENTLDRCIKSIELTGYHDLQIILVNDCSTDSSLSLCKKWQKLDNRIEIYSNTNNRGVSYSRNIGLNKAVHENICFVDSDDWVESSYFKEFAEIMSHSNMPLVITGYYNDDSSDTGKVDYVMLSTEEDIPNYSKQMELLYYNNLIQQVWNKCFKSKIIKDYKLGFNESVRIGEDFEFVLNYLKCAKIKSVKITRTPQYHYMRDQRESLMQHTGIDGISQFIKNRRDFLAIIGYSANEIESILDKEHIDIINNYIYLVLHNKSSSFNLIHKLKCVFDIDCKNKNHIILIQIKIYFKERIKYNINKIYNFRGKK